MCYHTAWRIKHKIMQGMTEREAGRPLGGIVTMDDAYLGGERNGGKAGRGSENKVPFVIALELSDAGHPHQAVMTPVSGFTLKALATWTQQHLHPQADVYSYGLGAFRSVIAEGHAHTVIESAGGRAATEAGDMRWLNTVPCRSPVAIQSPLRPQDSCAAIARCPRTLQTLDRAAFAGR